MTYFGKSAESAAVHLKNIDSEMLSAQQKILLYGLYGLIQALLAVAAAIENK